jgi:hypothetical protein
VRRDHREELSMLNVLAAGSVMMSLLVPIPAEPTTTTPPSEKITIDVVTVNGSGCPKDTATVIPSDDNTAFSVFYDGHYMAQAGPGISATESRKNCQLSLRVKVPGGFTYAIAQADYRGYAHLEQGASALEKSNFYFQGTSPTAQVTHPINGPLDDNWQATDQADLAAIVWHPCGAKRNLNINTEVRVTAGTDKTKTSFITMDSTDGSINTVYHFAWKKC